MRSFLAVATCCVAFNVATAAMAAPPEAALPPAEPMVVQAFEAPRPQVVTREQLVQEHRTAQAVELKATAGGSDVEMYLYLGLIIAILVAL